MAVGGVLPDVSSSPRRWLERTSTSSDHDNLDSVDVPSSGALSTWYPWANSSPELSSIAVANEGGESRLERGGDFTKTGNPAGLGNARKNEQGCAQRSPAPVGRAAGRAALTGHLGFARRAASSDAQS